MQHTLTHSAFPANTNKPYLIIITTMFSLSRFQKPPPPAPTTQDPTTTTSDTNSSSSSDSDSEPYDESEIETYLNAFRIENENAEQQVSDSEIDPETNYKDTMEALQSPAAKKVLERNARRAVDPFNPFDFPPDDEDWTEEDLLELWDNGNNSIGGTGWDPKLATPEEWDYVKGQLAKGKDVPVAPFYLPYRKPIPPIPNNNFAIKGPEGVIEELDRIEEFLKWVSYIFEDGTTYVKLRLQLL